MDANLHFYESLVAVYGRLVKPPCQVSCLRTTHLHPLGSFGQQVD